MQAKLMKTGFFILSAMLITSFNANANHLEDAQLSDLVYVTQLSKGFCKIQGAATGVCYMTAEKAAEYCEATGGHLPSTTEFSALGNSDQGIDELYWTSTKTADGTPLAISGLTQSSGPFQPSEPLAVRCVESK